MATEREIALMDEENQKFWKNLNETKEKSCLNRVNSGMICKDYCSYYGTSKCLHPEKVFPNKHI